MVVGSRGWAARVAFALGLGMIAAACEETEQEQPRVAVTVGALGGNGGSTGGPGVIMIHDCEELQAIEDDLGASYRLANNINCSSYDYGDGGGFKPLGRGGMVFDPFFGTFDGAGYIVTGLTMNRPWESGVALFGVTAGATIFHVGLEAVDITGHTAVAPLAGALITSTITECYATGTVTGTAEVGGLISSVKGESVVTDSYSLATVTGGSDVGLFSAWIRWDGEVHRVYAAGDSNQTGNLAALIADGGSINGSFFDCDVAGNCVGTGAADTADMQTETQYTTAGWDFSEIWSWRGVDTYPCLHWELGCDGVSCAASDTTRRSRT